MGGATESPIVACMVHELQNKSSSSKAFKNKIVRTLQDFPDDSLDSQPLDSQPVDPEQLSLEHEPVDSQPYTESQLLEMDSQPPCAWKQFLALDPAPMDPQPMEVVDSHVEEPTDALFCGPSSSGIPDIALSMPPPPVPSKAAKKQDLKNQLEEIRRGLPPKAFLWLVGHLSILAL